METDGRGGVYRTPQRHYKQFMATQDDGYDTLQDVWRVLIWILYIFQTGDMPHCDWDNVPFPPDSWRAKVAGRKIMGGLWGM